MPVRLTVDRITGLVFVLLLHALALYGLWQHQLIPSPMAAATLLVNFIAPPAVDKAEEAKRLPSPPKPKVVEKMPPRQLVAEAPVIKSADYVAPPAPPQPVAESVIHVPVTPLPQGPVALGSELAVACPERSAPSYPALSRRLNETGLVVLRVELNESGFVTVAKVDRSSSYPRLDEAALAAVRTWRCTPSTRNGQPVRATALQPFNFILNGN